MRNTANIIMTAVMAKGKTTIYNAACEPYLQQLCSMLNSMGAKITGVGSNLLTIEGVDVVNNIDRAIELATEYCNNSQQDEVMIIGGAQIYAATLEKADRLYLTEVDAQIEGDAFFPEFDQSRFKQTTCEEHLACDKNPYNYRFKILERT